MKKLKIAIVSDAVYPYNKGGKEKRIYEVSTRLAKAGHKVTIYCMRWWKGKSNRKIENRVRLQAISNLYPLYSGQRRSIKQAVFYALSCFRLLNKDFDVIEVDHMPHMVLFSTKIVCLIKRKKLIATWNEVWGRAYWKEYLGTYLGEAAYFIEWISSRLPDEINAVSEHTKIKLQKDLKINTKINVIPNGIDFKQIKKVKPSKEKSDIVFAGRLLKHKNVDVLIKSIKILKKDYPKIKAFIIGDGPEKDNIASLIKKLQLEKNIKLSSFLENHNDLYALIKSAKTFAFPSTREGFGIAVLEANACGVPVVTTNHKDNATKDLIQNGINGRIVKLEEKMIAREINHYITTNNNYISKRLIRNYDWDNITYELEKVYLK